MMPAPESVHIDLHGNHFMPPSFTMKQIHDAIPSHCFKPSTIRSLAYVVRDLFYVSMLIYIAVTCIPLLDSPSLRFAAWILYTTMQGFVFTGVWILAHESGHGAFSNSKQLNWIMGLVLHSFLLVPFHSWRLSHSQHHKNTGNVNKDTAYVPESRESWKKRTFGAAGIKLEQLTEDSPMAILLHCLLHQLLGWPGYLLMNLKGQEYGSAGAFRVSHFYFGKDSVLFKESELPLILLSDIGVMAMVAALVVAGQIFGSWRVIVLWGVPWLWVNNWIVAITFLQHTDGTLPHYNNGSWTFVRGATATIDRDLGFLDSHFFHDIIGTHVCHHLVSTIPFYHAREASRYIKEVMGVHYKADTTTPFWTAFWRNQRMCKFVEESQGCKGLGVLMFRNSFHGPGPATAWELKDPEDAGEDVSDGSKLKV